MTWWFNTCFTTRMLVGKTPNGLFKLSRDAILAADLPSLFTTKANWRGSLPRDLVCALCRQHRLSEPVFTVVCDSLKSDPADGDNKTVAESDNGVAPATNSKTSVEMETFRCNIQLFSKNHELILECSPEESFSKQGDAIQNASLKVLLWFNMYFKQPSLQLEKLSLSGGNQELKCHATSFIKEFYFFQLMHNSQQSRDIIGCRKRKQDDEDPHNGLVNKNLSMDGMVSGSSPSIGSLVSLSYAVNLVSDVTKVRERLESSDEFEFEVGTGGVISYIDAAVLEMKVGQSMSFCMDMPPKEFILASAVDYETVLSFLSSSKLLFPS